MNLEEYIDQDGMKVWLSDHEVRRLINISENTEQRIAFGVGARCGLRSEEIIRVAPEDVVDTDAGMMLRVWESAKTDAFRETPIPPNLATTIRTVGDVREETEEVPAIGVTKRTLRRWMQSAREELHQETGDSGWTYLGFHDLRRTWATSLRSADVDAMVVCDWGGWEDLETFLDHYRGTHSPEAQLRERKKVDWL